MFYSQQILASNRFHSNFDFYYYCYHNCIETFALVVYRLKMILEMPNMQNKNKKATSRLWFCVSVSNLFNFRFISKGEFEQCNGDRVRQWPKSVLILRNKQVLNCIIAFQMLHQIFILYSVRVLTIFLRFRFSNADNRQ